MTFGQLVKRRRQELDLTQSELAERMGLKQQSVAKFEKMTQAPRRSTIEKIAIALEMNPDELTPVFITTPNPIHSNILHPTANFSAPVYKKGALIQKTEGSVTSLEIPNELKAEGSVTFLEIPNELKTEIDQLVTIFISLNIEGKQKVLSYINDMGKIYKS